MADVENESIDSDDSCTSLEGRGSGVSYRGCPMPPMVLGDTRHMQKVVCNYWEARSWQHRHQVACWRSQVEALQYENHMLHEFIKALLTGGGAESELAFPPDEAQVSSPTPSPNRSRRNKKRKDRRKRQAKTKKQTPNESDDSLSCDDVDEDLLKFMEQTIRHRLERDNHPVLQKKKNRENRNKDTEAGVVCSVQPQEAQASNRVQEMWELFGSAAPKLLAMETAMQLTFNSNCDRHDPKTWPVLPLTI